MAVTDRELERHLAVYHSFQSFVKWNVILLVILLVLMATFLL